MVIRCGVKSCFACFDTVPPSAAQNNPPERVWVRSAIDESVDGSNCSRTSLRDQILIRPPSAIRAGVHWSQSSGAHVEAGLNPYSFLQRYFKPVETRSGHGGELAPTDSPVYPRNLDDALPLAVDRFLPASWLYLQIYRARQLVCSPYGQLRCNLAS